MPYRNLQPCRTDSLYKIGRTDTAVFGIKIIYYHKNPIAGQVDGKMNKFSILERVVIEIYTYKQRRHLTLNSVIVVTTHAQVIAHARESKRMLQSSRMLGYRACAVDSIVDLPALSSV